MRALSPALACLIMAAPFGCDCGARGGEPPAVESPTTAEPAAEEPATDLATPGPVAMVEATRRGARRAMVERQLAGRDITDARVLEVMGKVPRHRFVPGHLQAQAYADHPLPIAHDQTISQPYVVAFMSQALRLEGDEKVLEIGTGSGYQAAVLAELAREVYTIEIVEPLATQAKLLLAELGYENVHVRAGDGYRGWPEKAPFDAIMVTAAPDHVPEPLVEQLAVGGRMIIPVGDLWQNLILIERTPTKVTRQQVLPVRFVPMTGEAQKRR